MKFVLGQKKKMTQFFVTDGRVVPVTAVAVKPNMVVQLKTTEKDGYVAVQVGSGVTKKSHKKPQLGHLQNLSQSRWLREFRIEAVKQKKVHTVDKLKRGLTFGVEIFEAGDSVRVTGTSKGRGFQGVVKRHGFHGAPASHGTKDQLRMPGSIGATGPAHVFKGRRMPGRMGTDKVTVKGLRVVKVDKAKELLYINGALPGAYNSLVMISGPGTFKVKEKITKATEKSATVEAKPSPVVAADVKKETDAETKSAVKAADKPAVLEPDAKDRQSGSKKTETKNNEAKLAAGKDKEAQK